MIDSHGADDEMEQFDRRLGQLEGAYGETTKRLDSIDRRLLHLESKIDTVYQSLNGKIDRLTLAGIGAWVTVMLAIFFRH